MKEFKNKLNYAALSSKLFTAQYLFTWLLLLFFFWNFICFGMFCFFVRWSLAFCCLLCNRFVSFLLDQFSFLLLLCLLFILEKLLFSSPLLGLATAIVHAHWLDWNESLGLGAYLQMYDGVHLYWVRVYECMWVCVCTGKRGWDKKNPEKIS